MSKDVIETEGTITEVHKGGMFSVDVPFGSGTKTILAKVAGKMRKASIKLVVGDEVRVEMSPYDTTKGRITYRN